MGAGIGGESASPSSNAGAAAGSDGGNACQGTPVDESRWICFDSSVLVLPGQPVPADCAFAMPPHIGPDFDVQRLGIIAFDDRVLEIARLSSAEACELGAGGWFLGFDDESVATSIHLCACTCEALAAARQVVLLARCE